LDEEFDGFLKGMTAAVSVCVLLRRPLCLASPLMKWSLSGLVPLCGRVIVGLWGCFVCLYMRSERMTVTVHLLLLFHSLFLFVHANTRRDFCCTEAFLLSFPFLSSDEGGGVPSISGRRMGVEEAHKILEVKPGASAEELKKRSERLASINSPQGDFPGSPYLQSKVETAFKVLSEKSEKENDKETKSKGGGS